MNNSLNLASKPFSNRLLPWALTAVVLFVSLIGLVLVVRLTTTTRAEADRVEAEINQLKQQEQGLLTATKLVENSLTPEQQQALPAAHQLVDRKGFSWSRFLADLEDALPEKVKVTRIAVRDVNKQGDQTVAQLDLSVFAKDAATINDMISTMHQEGIFEAEIRNQNLQKGRGEAGTEYELFVLYRSRPGYSSDSVAKVEKGGGETAR
ncbi:MAG TPA: PilN domain-containing protein [Pyrinomonadaceae bacterium]